jgi:hypothetical protein
MAAANPPKPPGERRRRNVPARGEWTAEPGVGWQHGPVPEPPDGLLKASRVAWAIWMGTWVAAHWTPGDLPGLRQVIRLYDQVERGEFVRSSELRLEMDTYGITPKGQQDRRWRRPEPGEESAPAADRAQGGRYGHLRPVSADSKARKRRGA